MQLPQLRSVGCGRICFPCVLASFFSFNVNVTCNRRLELWNFQKTKQKKTHCLLSNCGSYDIPLVRYLYLCTLDMAHLNVSTKNNYVIRSYSMPVYKYKLLGSLYNVCPLNQFRSSDDFHVTKGVSWFVSFNYNLTLRTVLWNVVLSYGIAVQNTVKIEMLICFNA